MDQGLDELKTSKNSYKILYTIDRKGYFYPVTKSNSMNRMNLDQLVTFLENNEMPSSAHYFKGCANDSVTVDGLIEADFVKRHVMIGSETERSTRLWREIQANVTTYIGCEK